MDWTTFQRIFLGGTGGACGASERRIVRLLCTRRQVGTITCVSAFCLHLRTQTLIAQTKAGLVHIQLTSCTAHLLLKTR